MDVAVRGGVWGEWEEAGGKRRASIEFLVAGSGPEMSHWGNTTTKRRERRERRATLPAESNFPPISSNTSSSSGSQSKLCARACVSVRVFSQILLQMRSE